MSYAEFVAMMAATVALHAAVPKDVQLGVHFCYGDNDAKHFVDPLDLAEAVELANLVTDNAGRTVHRVHMPVPR